MKVLRKGISLITFLIVIAGIFSGCNSKETSNKKLTLADIETATIGIVTGTNYDLLVQKKFPKATRKYFSSTADVVLAMKQGKVDVLLADKDVYASMKWENADITCIDEPIESLFNALVLAKTGYDENLLNQINSFVAKTKNDGTLKALDEKWFGDYEPTEHPDYTKLTGENGTLKIGDCVVVGTHFGRIRSMKDDLGRQVKVALPSTPVQVTGLSDVPMAGDNFMGFADEKQAREIAEKRTERQIEKERHGSSALSLDDLYNQIKEGEVQTINVIVRADDQGSAEAVTGALQRIQVDGVKLNVIRHQAGTITETDVILASAANAIIFGFNVRPDAQVRSKAEEEGVDIRLY